MPRSTFTLCILLLLTATASVRAKDAHVTIDPFYFMAGLCVTGADQGAIDPPQCESFYREGGEQRVAELFLDAAKSWSKRGTSYYYQPGGKRLVVENRKLAEALQTFYTRPDGVGRSEAALLKLDRQQRLSFVAGIYARCSHQGTFHGFPTPTMQATLSILRAEGCEVSQVVLSKGEVPDTMHFQVKPSKTIADLFAIVDQWQPPHVEWKEK